MTTVLIAGLGGQGIVLASDIIARAAMHEGMVVKKSEIHGMSQRGGSVFSFVRYDHVVYSPVPRQGDVDVMVALELTEALRWRHFLHVGSSIVALDLYTPSYGRAGMDEASVRTEMALMRAQCERFLLISPAALEAGGRRLPPNVAMLGAASRFLGFGPATWSAAIGMTVKPESGEDNMRAFEAGAAAAR